MSGKIRIEKNTVQETLVMPLYGKAWAVKNYPDLFHDTDCQEIMDRLDYMQKGGRCSSVMALSGKLLKIKPCIAVRDGAMGMVDKYRGKYDKCVEKYIKDQLKDRKDLRLDRIFSTHSVSDPAIVELARETIKKYADFQEIHETYVGCTVACHCGPGTLGVLFITK